jgi:hypothetical protein
VLLAQMPLSDVRSTWSSIATVNRPPFDFVTLFHLRLCQPRANDCARELTPRTMQFWQKWKKSDGGALPVFARAPKRDGRQFTKE